MAEEKPTIAAMSVKGGLYGRGSVSYTAGNMEELARMLELRAANARNSFARSKADTKANEAAARAYRDAADIVRRTKVEK